MGNGVVLTVSQLNRYVKSIIEQDFNLQTVFVQGEISNFTNHYKTGHFYMTIKDEFSSIKAVMFKTANMRLKFMPENSMSVIIRGRVSEVSENIDGKVIVKAEDTLAGKPVKVTLDLLVLMSGMVSNPDSTKVAGMMSLPIDTDGFLKSSDNIFRITESPKPGIFYAGACTGPKTVPETLAEARSAALEIHSYITSRQ